MYEAIEHHKQYMKDKQRNNTLSNVMNVLSISVAVYVAYAVVVIATQL